jgi:dihydropyrimidine dehydrogenase (NAD+) subunit PreT
MSAASASAVDRIPLPEALQTPLDDGLAPQEADRCLRCGGPTALAPCTLACPAGIDVPGFVDAIARGDRLAAAAIIFAANALGGSCARVCPVEELCEAACVLDREGRRPISIARLQRHAADWALGCDAVPLVPGLPTGKHVIVIGAGPAGLACAAELVRLGHAVTVVDARSEVGGLVRFAIAPYRLQREPLPAEAARLATAGVRFRFETPVDQPERLRDLEREADALFLGVGLGRDADIVYPGDDLPGIWDSLPFIEALKTDRPPEVGERVVVIGGGNTAIDVTREALRLGAAKVTLVYRRSEKEMPAYPHEVREAREEGVELQLLSDPIRFLGNGHVERIECRRMRLGAPDASGRSRPEPVPASEFLIEADTVIKALGQQRRTGFLSWIDGLRLDHGLVAIDRATGQTSVPRYFAGGDAVNGGATVVEAVGAGTRAAHGIDRYLRDAGLPS